MEAYFTFISPINYFLFNLRNLTKMSERKATSQETPSRYGFTIIDFQLEGKDVEACNLNNLIAHLIL